MPGFIGHFPYENCCYLCTENPEDPFFIIAVFAFAQLEVSAAQPSIVFLSDFGTRDDSVSQCKAAIYAVNSEARITDLTHGVEAGSPVKVILAENELADVSGMAGGNIFLDIRYATASNFTKKKIYPASSCLLRRKAANALINAADKASKSASPFSLCVLDCYRPLSVQKIFWSIIPDERYVADPAKGSRHNRGMAVDVTACGGDAKELEMPTAYDDFSEKAHRDYKKASGTAAANSSALEKVMTEAGFLPLSTEWWHFDFPGWESMEISDEPLNN